MSVSEHGIACIVDSIETQHCLLLKEADIRILSTNAISRSRRIADNVVDIGELESCEKFASDQRQSALQSARDFSYLVPILH
jgi:hypothetical protein